MLNHLPNLIKNKNLYESNSLGILCKVTLLYVFLLYSTPIFASVIHSHELISPEKLADAIRRAEGNKNYGVKSVPCKTESACRKICLNSIRNNLKRYEKTDKSISFFQFMGNRYCPTRGNLNQKEKELNKFWVANVQKIYATL